MSEEYVESTRRAAGIHAEKPPNLWERIYSAKALAE